MTTLMNFRTSSGNLATQILKTIMVKFCRLSAEGLTLKFKMLSQPWLWEGPLTQTPQNVQHGTHSGWEQSHQWSLPVCLPIPDSRRPAVSWSASILPVHIAPSLPNTQYFSVSQEFWSELIRTTQNRSEQLRITQNNSYFNNLYYLLNYLY